MLHNYEPGGAKLTDLIANSITKIITLKLNHLKQLTTEQVARRAFLECLGSLITLSV